MRRLSVDTCVGHTDMNGAGMLGSLGVSSQTIVHNVPCVGKSFCVGKSCLCI